MHNLKTTGIFKISSYGDFATTFTCSILARNYNSVRIVSVKVLTFPVAAGNNLACYKALIARKKKVKKSTRAD